MQNVNVLLTVSISAESKQLIEAISPQVKLLNAAELIRSKYRDDPIAVKKLDELLADAEIIYGPAAISGLIARAPKLKWVQFASAGVDRFLTPELIRSKVILTNVSGIHATPIGEFVMEMMLMFVKKAPLCFEMKQAREWQRFSPGILRGKTIGIIGLGSIGQEIARLSKAFGMKIIATRRSIKTGHARNVDVLYSPERLPALLSESDFVVLSLPLTPETNKLIGAKELRMMKPTAYLINISRGPVIDETVLIQALRENWIAGAGLDVFTTEPLPKDSPVWELPNVLFSPHVSGGMEDYLARTTEVFCQNLRRYLKGKKLINIINKKKGY
ncbi:MAG: D-2-hydroxyacid dehydrogenase [Dehalococcoidales bacterium]|nr:D-2-hydroxyacid dehydrogenase [Dehalococcoidales bacterium]